MVWNVESDGPILILFQYLVCVCRGATDAASLETHISDFLPTDVWYFKQEKTEKGSGDKAIQAN